DPERDDRQRPGRAAIALQLLVQGLGPQPNPPELAAPEPFALRPTGVEFGVIRAGVRVHRGLWGGPGSVEQGGPRPLRGDRVGLAEPLSESPHRRRRVALVV